MYKQLELRVEAMRTLDFVKWDENASRENKQRNSDMQVMFGAYLQLYMHRLLFASSGALA